MNATVYNNKGEKSGSIDLPENIFGLKWNADLVHEVLTSMQANARPNVAHTKDRGEVRGGGKKPWQQKGTGRARHGSSRSPIWTGGGVTHGPRKEKIYARKINQKAKQKALLVALSRKAKDGELIFVDSLHTGEPKTKMAKAFFSAFTKNFEKLSKKKNAALIVLPAHDVATQKSFRNMRNLSITEVRNLNLRSVLSASYVVFAEPQAAIDELSKKSVVLRQAQDK